MITISSSHFGSIEIKGNQEKVAATYLSEQLTNATKAQEILAHHNAQQLYDVTVTATNSHIKDATNIPQCLL